MLTHKEMVTKLLSRRAVRAHYETQTEEFALLDEMLRARRRAGLTQAEVAKRMGTMTPAIARLEAGGGSMRHSPTLATLRKYAAAVGCQVVIKLRPSKYRHSKPKP